MWNYIQFDSTHSFRSFQAFLPKKIVAGSQEPAPWAGITPCARLPLALFFMGVRKSLALPLPPLKQTKLLVHKQRIPPLRSAQFPRQFFILWIRLNSCVIFFLQRVKGCKVRIGSKQLHLHGMQKHTGWVLTCCCPGGSWCLQTHQKWWVPAEDSSASRNLALFLQTTRLYKHDYA